MTDVFHSFLHFFLVNTGTVTQLGCIYFLSDLFPFTVYQ